VGTGSEPSRIAIAKIARTRGNKGEVLAELHTDYPARFRELERVWLETPSGRALEAVLEEAWEHQGRIVLKFAGYDSISSAEALVGAWVEVDSSEAVPLPSGTYFDHELVGCQVWDVEGRSLGVVDDVLRIKGNHQLVVAAEGGTFLVPATEGICRSISVERKEIVIDPPEGLLDLNR
jgi:16S rRNA processing protein RimM